MPVNLLSGLLLCKRGKNNEEWFSCLSGKQYNDY